MLLKLWLALGWLPIAIEAAAIVERVASSDTGRERINLSAQWKFQRYTANPDGLSYATLRNYILPSSNDFIKDPTKRFQRPTSQLANVTFAQSTFDDRTWESVSLPHDWAIKGPFYTGGSPVISSGMGRLPIQGVGWYRRQFSVEPTDIDRGKSFFLDIDGAMSYATVWLNGVFIGGWPYGYASFRLDMTPYIRSGNNQLAIRVDNAVDSSRFYPGAGIYRNVWLVKVSSTHVAQWGTRITTPQVSASSATINLVVQVENSGKVAAVDVVTEIYVIDGATGQLGEKVGQFPNATLRLEGGAKLATNSSITLQQPRLWGPMPLQVPNLYVAVTRLYSDSQIIDTYETRFGIRTLQYSNDGLRINGQRVYLQGVCQHHDLGSLGSAFNVRAAERQLEMLREMGSNAIRTSHNPPAPELLDLADRLGFVVLDEIFDVWQNQKVRNDFHLIFNDWHEADLRAFIRRDRNHPSVWAWSVGNEVGEQSSQTGASIAQGLKDIVRDEDPGRAITVAMNSAGANAPLIGVVDLIGLNYQGEGGGSNTAPTFPSFRARYPDKMIFSTESSSAISTRGTYLFPVTKANSANAGATQGEDTLNMYVSAYDLYSVTWGSSPDKVFAGQDQYPYVAGEFVWTGWDYIGEPTPFGGARSSYFGIIDLAGFPKDRYYLYQSRWNPSVKMAHILPHWNWPDRVNQVTPVHVFSSGDEAELFLNGKSQGRQKKLAMTYRFRWDNIVYQPGELHVVTYRNGVEWANATVRTTGAAARVQLTTYRGRMTINGDGADLSFITAAIVDDKGDVVPLANNLVSFSVDGPGEIVSTDNGNPTDMSSFLSKERKAFNGLALAIVRTNSAGNATSSIRVTATSSGLVAGQLSLAVQ